MYYTGIDVSEHNGEIDWEEIRRAGIAFAIIRLGWGRGHLDRLFYEHINGALAAGLPVGVYYYSYADTPKAAEDEAWFTVHVLADCGLSPEKLPLGVWYDMEDADGWKAARGLVEPSLITAMCGAYVDSLKSAGYLAGVYASYDWLTQMIFPERASAGLSGARSGKDLRLSRSLSLAVYRSAGYRRASVGWRQTAWRRDPWAALPPFLTELRTA